MLIAPRRSALLAPDECRWRASVCRGILRLQLVLTATRCAQKESVDNVHTFHLGLPSRPPDWPGFRMFPRVPSVS